MARKRKAIKIEQKPNYVVEDFKNPPKKQVLGYRRVKTKSGHVITVAIMRKKGTRGGRTKVTSVWHPRTEKKSSNPAVTRALRKRRSRTGTALEAFRKR